MICLNTWRCHRSLGTKKRLNHDTTSPLSRAQTLLNLHSPMGAALPPASEASKRHGLDANATSAYNVCLDFEASAKDSPSDLIRARILGYLILYSPSTMAQHEFVKVIHSCGFKKESLSVLGTTFLDYYIRPCKQSDHILRLTR